MHNSYYFLSLLSKELRSKLIGFDLVECFSQNKNELILSFQKGSDEFHIQINLNNNFNALCFKSEFHKAKSGFQNHFKALNGLRCIKVVQVPFDRSFFIEFEDESKVLFKLHGNRSNILWLNDLDEVKGIFIGRHVGDWKLDLTEMQKAAPDYPSNFENRESIKQGNPYLGKTATDYLFQSLVNLKIESEKIDFYETFIDLIVEKPCFSIDETGLNIQLWDSNPSKSYPSAIDVSNELFSNLNHYHFFTLRKENRKKELEKEANRLSKYLLKTEIEFEKLILQASYKELADVIMANLHLLKEAEHTYQLVNFYNQEIIEFKFKKNEKPQLIAQKLYSKSKNQHIQIKKLEETIELKKSQLEEINQQLHDLDTIESSKELNKFLKENNPDKEQKNEKPFKSVTFQGFEILIGRNSKNNDELVKFGNKNDLWLHAKDVAGSHVLIRCANKKPNKQVIDRAASLAAYYSKRKSDSICPVIVTELKYVRKKKGLLPGQVIVEREEIVFTVPYSIQVSNLE